MPLKLITAPAIEPLDIEEVKNFLKITDDEDDFLLASLISAARLQAEKITGRQLITASWELYLDNFPAEIIKIPRPPLQSIPYEAPAEGGILYLDSAGDQQTLSATLYRVDAISEPGRVTPAYGYTWPTTYPVINAVTIPFIAGYGDNGGSIPEDILNWIRVMVGVLYENRELAITQALTELKFLDGLLDEYRVWVFG
jgi:uncharacterized phiE125 gp8 family phage protein